MGGGGALGEGRGGTSWTAGMPLARVLASAVTQTRGSGSHDPVEKAPTGLI